MTYNGRYAIKPNQNKNTDTINFITQPPYTFL